MKFVFLLGRAVFGGFFLYNGIHHFAQHSSLAQYAGAKQVPQPDTAVKLSGLLLLIGGSSVILGYKPKLGIAAIAAFLASVSPMMHDFWNAQDDNQRQNDMINFTKNLALLGAAMALAGIEEPWPAAVPEVLPRSARRAIGSTTRKLIA
ncbi:MAG TPA: DoxX family membrane protein [Bryobacteraceae bacterium]|nr:DoxX family membrane protein [Bryobacteraceae bacterium]